MVDINQAIFNMTFLLVEVNGLSKTVESGMVVGVRSSPDC